MYRKLSHIACSVRKEGKGTETERNSERLRQKLPPMFKYTECQTGADELSRGKNMEIVTCKWIMAEYEQRGSL